MNRSSLSSSSGGQILSLPFSLSTTSFCLLAILLFLKKMAIFPFSAFFVRSQHFQRTCPSLASFFKFISQDTFTQDLKMVECEQKEEKCHARLNRDAAVVERKCEQSVAKQSCSYHDKRSFGKKFFCCPKPSVQISNSISRCFFFFHMKPCTMSFTAATGSLSNKGFEDFHIADLTQ